ncbi:hypothetical protein [Paenibacillus sp. MMS18-CY102]|uniref:hypothetical protein n=1 Tax=Paenibacillus sp. MMS18-CY102 TaxID=2682849 RepID=UPI0013662044|nr:hypothetical protein [Paenibacillus sp. MMS18-CY102]MWC27571.1 hypothetical protein [Paenibacillus sp. MMS18-CY102]
MFTWMASIVMRLIFYYRADPPFSEEEALEFERLYTAALFNGKAAEAVFASADGIWSIFYAVFDRRKVGMHASNQRIATAIIFFH